MKWIQREETDLGGYWKLKMKVGTSDIVQKFADADYGGEHGALRAAQDFLRRVLTPGVPFLRRDL